MPTYCKLTLVFIQALLSSASVFAQSKAPNDQILANPEGEFAIALAEYTRQQSQNSNLPIRFRLEYYAAIKERDGKPEYSNINWDGDNLLIDSDRFVYVSTPYRAFLLVRDSQNSPLSIQFISPISSSERTVEEIIQFDSKVGDGYMEASRPTEMRRYNCQLSLFVPREGASVSRAVRTQEGMIRFDYQRTAKPEELLIREAGNCTVDPLNGFAVVQGQIDLVFKRTKANALLSSQFEYYPATGSLPQLIKSYKHQQIPVVNKAKNSIYQQYYYSDYAIEPMPKEKLTLEYYGLPDPLTSPTKFWGWPAALIGAGILAIIVFIMIRYRRRRGHE